MKTLRKMLIDTNDAIAKHAMTLEGHQIGEALQCFGLVASIDLLLSRLDTMYNHCPEFSEVIEEATLIVTE